MTRIVARVRFSFLEFFEEADDGAASPSRTRAFSAPPLRSATLLSCAEEPLLLDPAKESKESTEPVCNRGSEGHPFFCARPCIRYHTSGTCQLGSDCGFCHHVHEPEIKLDKRHRAAVHTMPLSELFEIMWPLLERRARDAGVSEADIQEMYQVLNNESRPSVNARTMTGRAKQNFRQMLRLTNKKVSMLLSMIAGRCSADGQEQLLDDVAFGRWRFAAPPWAAARLAELGSLANLGDAPHGGAASARTPVLLRNGLPTSLVFGADGSEEVLLLPAGTQQSYIWCLCGDDDRRLTFGRDAKAPRSVALNLSDPAVAETGCNAWTSLTLPASAESAPLWTICVSVRRVSCAQMEVELLPPMMLRSELRYALEFQLLGPGGCVEPDEEMSPGSSRPSSDAPLCSCNRILQERHFMKGLPSSETWGARETRSVTGSEIPAQLAANSLIGLLPPPGGHLRLRPVGAEEWAPELPLSDSPQALPFTTLLSFPEDDGISDTVLCVCHDLFGVPEEDARGGYPEGALQPPGSIGSAPQVLCLRPLLRFSHCCPGRMKLTALPLGTALADSGDRQAVRSKGGDPRQLRYLELQVFPDGDESKEAGAFSSGPLLLGGLVQFPFNEADSLVSWRNSVRCSRGEAEHLLLLELRRCRLSGLLRDVVAEPMWRVQNETGSDVLFGLAAGSGAECSRGLHPVTLHRATPGETWSTALGPLQHDPSFPLVVSFGAERGGCTSWTQDLCR
eukprot:s355_g6.t1